MDVATIGLDLAKHWFQIHGIDAQGAVVIRRKLRRGEVVAFFAALPPCVVGMEACATAHHWSRELSVARDRQTRFRRAADEVPRAGWRSRPPALSLGRIGGFGLWGRRPTAWRLRGERAAK
jgi:hypothetical protein